MKTIAQIQHKASSIGRVLPLAFGLLFAVTAGTASAQTAADAPGAAPATRDQVKKERDEFLRTHSYDERNDEWVLKPGVKVEPPAGVKTRAEIKAERDAFLRNNRWDTASADWVPLKNGPRELSTLTRQQERAETLQFVRTHHWDSENDMWVPAAPPRTKK